MKRKSLFKSLLVAAGLLVGGSAWADAGDVKTNANIDFSNAIESGVVAGTVNSMTIGSGEIARNGDTGWLSVYDATSTVTIPATERAQSKDIVNVQFKMAWGNKKNMGSGFSLKDANGDDIAYFKYARWDDNATNTNTLSIDMAGLVGAHGSNKPIAGRYTLFDVTVNYAARTITSKVYCNNTDGKGTTKEVTFSANLSNTNPIATFNVFGYGVGGNTDRASIIDDILIKTTEGDYSVTTYDYTVNWVCGSTIVKTAIRQGEKDAPISLLDNDKTTFTQGGVKYFYVGDDASGKTVADDGSTIVTIEVREAETWNYTVNAIDESNNILGTITTGTVVEGESVYYYYPIFYLSGNKLLRADINDKTYGKSGTPTADNEVFEVTYKDKGLDNVVFYKECEDIEGMTAVSAGNVPVRCSNGKGALASTETKITTLSPGIYTISGFAWGNSGTVFTLKAKGNTVATFTTVSSTVNISTSKDFLVTEDTDVVIEAQGNGGTSPKVIDFLYIQKTGEYYQSMAIQGDFFDNGWDLNNGIAMTRDAENPHIWTAVYKDYVVSSGDMDIAYKATANGVWDVYQVGDDDETSTENQTYSFDFDGAGVGTYDLTFTLNTKTNRVSMLPSKQIDYILVGCFNDDSTPAFFGQTWDVNSLTNVLTPNGDGTYSKTFYNVALDAGTIYYKVTEGRSWDKSWGFPTTENPGKNADYGVTTAGNYDITFTFNPLAKLSNGYNLTCELTATPTTVTKHVSSAGYATFCSPYDLDFSSVTGLIAYNATISGDNVTFNEVTTVAASEGILLAGAEGDYEIPITTGVAMNVDNMLIGVLNETTITETGIFVLMNGVKGVGFYKTNKAFTLGANTAYLPVHVSSSNPARDFIGFGGEETTTSIEGIAPVLNDNKVYNLNGQRVVAPQKGLYIVNGKKVVLK